LYLITSNHGANSGGEEYIRRIHNIYFDQNLVLTYTPGEPSCEPYRVYNTQGNGIYGPNPRTDAQWQSFSNWCPGAAIPIREINLGFLNNGAHTFKIDVPAAVFANNEGNFPVSLYLQGTRANLGAEEIKNNKFTIAPNPVTNKINIHGDFENLQKLYITDLLGNSIPISQNFISSIEIELKTEQLASGTYFIHISTKEGKESYKFVKI
jgi:hypothetical protein